MELRYRLQPRQDKAVLNSALYASLKRQTLNFNGCFTSPWIKYEALPLQTIKVKVLQSTCMVPFDKVTINFNTNN